jgi:hypothetical protein
MSDPAEAIFDGIEAALRASAALATATGNPLRIYDVVPANALLPYVVIGDDNIVGDDTVCAPASEIFATVHAWSKSEPPSSRQARQMGAAIRAALTAQLTLTGFEVIDWEFQGALYNTDPDGSTHGRFIFHYFVNPTT